MEQDELFPNELRGESGAKTRKKLKKLGIVERKHLRMISADPPFNKTLFGCNEEFVSEERDQEIRTAWKEKVGFHKVKY